MQQLLSSLVDYSAEREPSRYAFRCANAFISYEQLARASNRLAHYLKAEGVKRHDRVGIFLPRCLETAIAVYGVMKTGAAFVPIDPFTPERRFRQIISDCDIQHLITNPSKSKFFQDNAFPGLTSILGCENTDEKGFRGMLWSVLDQFPGTSPATQIAPEDLAYVMYTSGSTGKPKGIKHTHQSGLSYAQLSAATYDIQPTDVVGNPSPLHFDMSTFGYFTAPLCGATTSIVPTAYVKMPASLSQLMQDHRMTVWYSVPFALIQLLFRGAIEQRSLETLRWILFGGEPFPPKHLYALMSKWHHARFSNVYGPAEVNQCTYFHVPTNIPRSERERNIAIPIGKVWDRTKAILLNQGQPVDDGKSVGELLIHSTTMMQGYWQRPDLDKRAFFKDDDGVRYYCTGDLVQRDPDGILHFLGRKDRQIKLRGHRIELDDIEVALTAHPAVEEAGVYPIVNEGEVIEVEAALLIRSHSQSTSVLSSIEKSIANSLPTYAIPSKIVIKDALPRTTSGKIDRRVLQEHAEAARGEENADEI